MIQRMTVLFLLCVSLNACSQGQTVRDATVERIEVAVVSAVPARAWVTAYGFLSSGCATLHETEQRHEGSTFFVTITEAEPANQTCTPEAPPFTEEVMLEGGSSSGTYTVDVNGVTETFTLP